MTNPKQVVRQGSGRPVSCRVAARAVALMSVLGSAVALWALPAAALAVSQLQLQFRCLARVGVDHGSTVVRCRR
jgi:hypothetical protein